MKAIYVAILFALARLTYDPIGIVLAQTGTADTARADELRPILDAVSAEQEQLSIQKLQQLSKGESRITALSFASDGSHLIASDQDNDCAVWNLTTGKMVTRAHIEQKVTCVAIMPGGRYAMAGGEFDGVSIWDPQTGRPFGDLPNLKQVTHLAASDDGNWIAAIDSEFLLMRSRVPGDFDSGRMFAGGRKVMCFAISPDASWAVAAQNLDRRVTLVNLTEDQAMPRYSFQADYPILKAAISDQDIWMSHSKGISRRTLEFEKEQASTITWPVRSLFHAEMRVSQDNKVVVVADANGQVNVVHTDYYGLIRYYLLPLDMTCSALAIAADGRTLATGHANGKIVIWQLPRFDLRGVQFNQLIHRLLTQGDFALLDRVAEELSRDSTPFPWSGAVSKYTMMIHYLGADYGRADNRPPADACEQWLAARPDSVMARLYLGNLHINRAWEARGSGFAATVTEQGWKEFHAQMSKAWEMIEPIGEREQIPGNWFSQAFNVAKAESWPDERVDPLVEKLLKQAPLHFDAHAARAEMLMPRWGGKPGDCEAYARRVADHIGGPQGDEVYAHVAVRLRHYYPLNQFFEITGFDYDRVAKGFVSTLERFPTEANMAEEGLVIAMLQGDQSTAAKMNAAMEANFDPWDEKLWSNLIRYRKAKAWAQGD